MFPIKTRGSTYPANAWVTQWKTDNAGTSTSSQIKIPTHPLGTYNCTVYWGDGTSSAITTHNDAAWTHTYPAPGIYTVIIVGTFNGIYFAKTGDRFKILNISQWGTGFRMGIQSDGQHFYGCENLTITANDVLNLAGVTTFFWSFRECISITTIPRINEWNVSAIVSFAATFFGASKFISSISNWDTTNATTFGNMLTNCNLWNQDISKFKVPNVTSMVNMLLNTAFSQTNYDLLLNPTTGWPSQSLQSNVAFHAGTAKYGAGAPATGRAFLTGAKLWTITDGGPA